MNSPNIYRAGSARQTAELSGGLFGSLSTKEKAMVASVIGGGLLSVVGVGALANYVRADDPLRDHTPTERHGDHHGSVHHTQPGTGVMHTKSGDFRVTQK